MAAAAGRTLVLPAEPVHHVTGVSSVTTAQAEVGGAPNGHVTDGTLEGQTLTAGTLSPTGRTAAVTAVHAELCTENKNNHKDVNILTHDFLVNCGSESINWASENSTFLS